jgi:hypothetical protein
MVGGSLRVLRHPPPLKLVCHEIAEILLKVALKHQQSKSNPMHNKGNNKITELRTILQRESQNS